MNGHTPGTWRAVDGRILPDNYVLEGAPIATVHARKKTGMQEANARLIAAAPLMLKACELFAAYDLVEHDDFETMVTAYAEAIEATHAAIAAATGEAK